MAGEWLKFESSLPDKPETLAITAAMGWDDPDLTVGKLMRVFRWFDQQTIDGNADGVTPALLDRVIGVTGIVQALVDVGWINVTEGGLALKNFDRHNGASAKSRAQTAKRVANFRAEHQENQTLRERKDPTTASNAPSVTKALAREEKRREEKSPIPPSGAVKRFEDFWLAWPKSERKHDRVKCREKWAKAGLDAIADTILADVKAKRGTQKWRDGYIEAPEVYLNNRRWEDGGLLGDSGGENWWSPAGFANEHEAKNEGCHSHTAHLFRDGKRIEEVA